MTNYQKIKTFPAKRFLKIILCLWYNVLGVGLHYIGKTTHCDIYIFFYSPIYIAI